MAKTKGSSKNQQKRGVDFKKIKRKLGRKLPPPKNATNTEIKSKAIVLPEQSVASEKAGLAVSKKGLTLKELLQHTSHHNAKVRKDALLGMKDLFLRYPEELKSHRYAVIEKLRERICDEDKIVREGLFQLLKSSVLPGCKEDNQEPLISLMMAYIFNAMTHLNVDVRLMAFKFFDLVIQYYPPSFSIYSEKILQNYEDILRKNQFYLQDKGKLKNTLSGLARCLSLLPANRRETHLSDKNGRAQETMHSFEPDAPTESSEFLVIAKKLNDILPVLVSCFQEFIPLIHSTPLLDAKSFDCMLSILQSIDLVVRFFVQRVDKSGHEETMWDRGTSSILLKNLLGGFPLNPVQNVSDKDDDRYFILNMAITEIFLHSSKCIFPPAELLNRFLLFIEHALLGQNVSGTHSQKAAREKQILILIPFIPKLLSQLIGDQKSGLLKAFTKRFLECNLESPMKLACLAGIEEMLLFNINDSDLLDFQKTWISKLPMLLLELDDKHPSSSQSVLHLLLRVGQCSLINSELSLEYDKTQNSIMKFYSTCLEDGNISYGPFIKLGRDIQELSVCCLYYFPHLDSLLLKSIAAACIRPELDTFILFRVIEVLHSAYSAGHIDIADYTSFFVTLLSRFKVFPENTCGPMENDAKVPRHGTFKSVTRVVSSCLSQMGDNNLVFMILERVILEQIASNLPIENACALLRMLVELDSSPTKLSEQSIITLSHALSKYLIDVAHTVPEDDEPIGSVRVQKRHYYLLPCFFLFDRSPRLLNLVVNRMGSLIAASHSPLSSDDYIDCANERISRMDAIVSSLLSMYRDPKVQQILSVAKEEIFSISQCICSLLVPFYLQLVQFLDNPRGLDLLCFQLLQSFAFFHNTSSSSQWMDRQMFHGAITVRRRLLVLSL
ncbi:hypothetical protein Tsubulata_013897 [Turnera subulata]|uniref:Pre-rRNA-processing protein Ipi1 N-terminal domain-containing protein n=1 Tax=Turnera subulata TaxID=218843 RepID=A0A9Q0J3J1_9ROSI|nr:hypothetical protein Tsubulata_013897 [Turnera subulata]